MAILEELYYGNIQPGMRLIKEGSEYQQLSRAVVTGEERLFRMLREEERAIYDNIQENRFRREGISEKETFAVGFRLGAQIMLEVLNGSDTQFIEM